MSRDNNMLSTGSGFQNVMKLALAYTNRVDQQGFLVNQLCLTDQW